MSREMSREQTQLDRIRETRRRFLATVAIAGSALAAGQMMLAQAPIPGDGPPRGRDAHGCAARRPGGGGHRGGVRRAQRSVVDGRDHGALGSQALTGALRLLNQQRKIDPSAAVGVEVPKQPRGIGNGAVETGR